MGDLDQKVVLVTGGSGGLGVSMARAFLREGAKVALVDVDADAVELARGNAAMFGEEGGEDELLIEFVQADLRTGALAPQQAHGAGWGGLECLGRLRPDTVIMNPPFGTKTGGADRVFLEAAFRALHARAAAAADGGGGVIYSLHKSSTRQFIERVGRELGGPGCVCRVVAEMRYELPRTYRFHRRESVDIRVDFWCVAARALRSQHRACPRLVAESGALLPPTARNRRFEIFR